MASYSTKTSRTANLSDRTLEAELFFIYSDYAWLLRNRIEKVSHGAGKVDIQLLSFRYLTMDIRLNHPICK